MTGRRASHHRYHRSLGRSVRSATPRDLGFGHRGKRTHTGTSDHDLSLSRKARTPTPHTWTLWDVLGTVLIGRPSQTVPEVRSVANERLRAVMLSRGLDTEAAGKAVGVDPKTVERWIAGRTPHRRSRLKLAAVLREDECYLWPDGIPASQQLDVSRAELISFFPHRSLIPSETWLDFFGRAAHDIGVLVHAGGFLAENGSFLRLLSDKAATGVRIRILLGDPDSPEVLRRGQEEGLGEGVAYKVRNALACYRQLFGVQGITFRLHRSTLHNSLYQSDSEWLVNTQVYGMSAPQAPVFHLRHVIGADVVSVYERSFEKVWTESRDLPREGSLS